MADPVAEIYDDLNREREAVCPLPARYLQLPTLVKRFLQNYFAQQDHRWLDAAKDFVHLGDRAPLTEEALGSVRNLEIYRTDEYRGDVDRKLPKLVIRRSAVAIQVGGISQGRRQGMAPNRAVRGKVVARSYSGSVVIFALSPIPGEADLLGAEAEQLLQHFGDDIRTELSMQRLQISQLGELGTLEEFPGFFAVPVVLDYIYEDNIELSRGQFPLRKIILKVDS